MNKPIEPTAYKIDASPGDGTRYQLVLVPRYGGGWLVVWEDMGVMGKVLGLGTEDCTIVWLARPPEKNHRHAGKYNGQEYDAEAIAKILNASFPWGGV